MECSTGLLQSIGTAALLDYGIVSEDDRSNVIDHHKVWRARQQLRKDMKKAGEHIDDDIHCTVFCWEERQHHSERTEKK